MNMLDPRQIFMNPFVYNIDPSTVALLGTTPGTQNSGAGKMSLNSSFRISDILESAEEKANTSGEHESSSVGEEERSGSVESRRSVTSPQSSASCGKKVRKARTIFTDKQLQELEATFDKQKYLSVQDRMDLAQRMGLSDTQVKTWYQNRRTKWKRQAAVGMDLLNEASNVAAVQQLLRTNPYWANYMAASSLSQPRLFPFPAGSAAALQGALPIAALQGAIPTPLPHSALPTIAIPSSAPSTTINPSQLPSTHLPLAMFPFQLPPAAGFTLNLTHCTPTERPKTPPSSEMKAESK